MLIIGSFNFLRKNVQHAIETVQVIKSAVDSKELDVLTALTKFEWDEKLLQKVRKALEVSITGLKLVNCSNEKGLANQIQCMLTVLRESPDWYKDSVYSYIASTIVQKTNDDKIRKVEADTLVQLWYSRLKNKEELPVLNKTA